DDEGPEVRDAAGGHHGTVHGAVSVVGRRGRALLFDRSRKDHVEVPYAPDLELSSFTVAAAVKLTKPPTFSGVLGTRQGGRQLFDLKVNTDKVHGDIGDDTRWIETKVNFYKDDVGGDGQGGDLDLDRWYLVTYVIDAGRQECRLYLDGDRKKTIRFRGTPVLMRPGATLRIGDTGAGEFMDGVIDDLRIWREPLDDAQVRSLVRPAGDEAAAGRPVVN
ncbi:MAG: LamG domain-containing protein, partial [Planctomycetia bacterium]|nr:LamG domain-containing protein [Planctomycetia bacterium]